MKKENTSASTPAVTTAQERVAAATRLSTPTGKLNRSLFGQMTGALQLAALACLALTTLTSAQAAKVAYIHGDVSQFGDIPSGTQDAYDQMLLTDTGPKGMSSFRQMVLDEGHTIDQRYDQNTTLNSTFLSNYDVIVFGLHQKIWSAGEKQALDIWIRGGGSIFIYSDSAAGGFHRKVGGQNTTGQTVVNNLISQYGMQVTVDQANGVKAYRAGPGATHPIVAGRPILEGEGVSPVAVNPNSGAVALIPYIDNPDYKVSGTPTITHQQNITIANPIWAALALRKLENGYIIAQFDRQPMWNNGPGSSILKRDNLEILRRVVNFLADNATSPTTVNLEANAFTSESNPGDNQVIRITGNVVGYIRNNSWIAFDGVDFGSGVTSATVSASSARAGGNLELRLGSPTGTLIGTIPITNTGSWTTFQPFSTTVNVSGVKNLYLVFKATPTSSTSLFDLQTVSFQ